MAVDGFRIGFNSTNDILDFLEEETKFWDEVAGLQTTGDSAIVRQCQNAYPVYKDRLETIVEARNSFEKIEDFKAWLNAELIAKLGLNRDSGLLSKNSTLARKIKDLVENGINHLVINDFYGLVNKKDSNQFSITSQDTMKALALASQYMNDAVNDVSYSESGSQAFDDIKSSFLTSRSDFVSKADELLDDYSNSFSEASSEGKRLESTHKRLHRRLIRKNGKAFEESLEFWKNKVTSLENLYEEKLKLDKPAKYWDQKARDYKADSFLWACALFSVLVVGFFVFGNFFSDWLKGDFKVLNLASFQGAAIFLVTVTTYFYIIRILSKITLSLLHLSRDAEERAQLTYFYLSLSNNAEIDNETRKMIMQSLFTRTESGLLGGDASTKFPSDFPKMVVGSQK